MSIDFWASRRHLIDHLAPIWHALEPDEQGTFLIAHRILVDYAHTLGIDAKWSTPQMPGPLTVAANYADYTQIHEKRPIAYVEHGAGQTYPVGAKGEDRSDDAAYSGGSNRQRVSVFLTLNETTAARERARYPDADVQVVGSPRLDGLASQYRDRPVNSPRPAALRPVLGIAFHWNAGTAPEARGAFDYWRGTFADLVANGWTVLGHGHPRIYESFFPWYRRHGIEPVEDFGELLERADVICVDNSSVLYEAAALDVPVVALNAPWYRRDVTHGLRFWDLIPGPQADTPDDLLAAVDEAPRWTDRRTEVSALVYPHRGDAARRAADVLRHHATAIVT